MSEQPETSPVQFASAAQLATKRFGPAPRGILSLSDGTLRFDDSKRGITLQVPVTEMQNLRGPLGVGTALRFEVAGKRYTAGFFNIDGISYPSSGPAGSIATAGSTFGQIGSARELCAAWLSLLRD